MAAGVIGGVVGDGGDGDGARPPTPWSRAALLHASALLTRGRPATQSTRARWRTACRERARPVPRACARPLHWPARTTASAERPSVVVVLVGQSPGCGSWAGGPRSHARTTPRGGTVSDLLAITTWVYGEGPGFKLLVPSPLCSPPPWKLSPQEERVGESQRRVVCAGCGRGHG